MSTNKTSNLIMNSWAPTDNVKRVEFNENFDILDNKSKEIDDTIASIQQDVNKNTNDISTNNDSLVSQLADITLNVKQFSSSVINGDWGLALMAAHNSLPANGGIIEFSDDVTIKSAVSFSKKVILKGRGYSTLNDPARRPKATVYKTGNFDGITLTFPGSVIQDVHIEGTTGNGGNGIVVLNGLCALYNVSSALHGGDGIRVGGSASQNCNAFRLINIYTYNNTGNGVHIEDTAQPTLPNNNAGLIMGLYSNNNTGDGLYLQNAADNGLYSVTCQNNTGYGIHFGSGAGGNQIFTPYTENNTAGDIVLDSGSKQNYVWGYRANNNDGIVDNGTGNFVMGRDASYNYLPFFKSPFTTNGFNIQNTANSGVWNFAKDGTNRDLVLSLVGTSSSGAIRLQGSGGQVYTTKVDKLNIANGSANLTGILRQGATLSFGTVPASSFVDKTITVTGAAFGDHCMSSKQVTALEGGLSMTAFVSAANTVTIRITNPTASGIAVSSEGFTALVIKTA